MILRKDFSKYGSDDKEFGRFRFRHLRSVGYKSHLSLQLEENKVIL
jgi:hypothetical protein